MAYPFHPTINTSPITPSFPSFPWELFTPYYTHASSSPKLYLNHGYSPHPFSNPYLPHSHTLHENYNHINTHTLQHQVYGYSTPFYHQLISTPVIPSYQHTTHTAEDFQEDFLKLSQAEAKYKVIDEQIRSSRLSFKERSQNLSYSFKKSQQKMKEKYTFERTVEEAEEKEEIEGVYDRRILSPTLLPKTTPANFPASLPVISLTKTSSMIQKSPPTGTPTPVLSSSPVKFWLSPQTKTGLSSEKITDSPSKTDLSPENTIPSFTKTASSPSEKRAPLLSKITSSTLSSLMKLSTGSSTTISATLATPCSPQPKPTVWFFITFSFQSINIYDKFTFPFDPGGIYTITRNEIFNSFSIFEKKIIGKKMEERRKKKEKKKRRNKKKMMM
ncbi:uncharacterized protein LOC131610657 [Vicia villosa]|uniref:uncharacterized protein LOC131610657 n=1 Tax=Vicia villosa TaxID=3911 RepID=UPI00273CCFAA|nr:uncharacterized protein LOC131610657 [Vicia villosa]